MFGIPEGTEVQLVPRDTYASSGFNRMVKFTTREFRVFDVSKLIIDPSGVSAYAATAVHKSTIGGELARRGYYAFALADPHRHPNGDPESRWYAVLVPADAVEVN